MNTVLWILQVALGLKLASVAYTHTLGADPAKMQPGRQRLGAAARPLLAVIALGALLGAVGLILPAATGVAVWLAPLAAALLAVMMLLAIAFHIKCRETPNIVVSLVLLALAAFVCYGRWVIAPF